MSDIFISYSSKDKEKADQLSELLASAGLSVWIDQSGIEIATSWSGEIVDAIENCKAFVVLLSPASIESKNVVREVSLAFEKNKKILPLDLEPVALSRDLQYLLAGIQRAPMTNIDAIIRAIGKLGLEATQAPTLKLVKESDGRKSLMILPFEDLSPTGDNGWFADGIANELISALSSLKELRVSDQQSTKAFKKYQGTLAHYAKEMSVQYFIQGDVRKFGDQIKISSRLLDIESGDHLWQDSMRGKMEDIFDIQETVARKVVEGFKLHLTNEENKKLSERGTENPEAYELYLKADEYFSRQTKEGFQLSIQLHSEAIALDPKYVRAYTAKALSLANLYRTFDHNPAYLEEGLALIGEARQMKTDLLSANFPLSILLMLQGKHSEAEEVAKEYVRKAPENYISHFALGFFYGNTNQQSKAITPYEESLKLKLQNMAALWNLILAIDKVKDFTKRKYWSDIAIPIFEKHQKLFPDDWFSKVSLAMLLYYAGRVDEARIAAQLLEGIHDGFALYNSACLHCALGDYASGISAFRKAIDAGFRGIRSFSSFLESEDDGIGKLKGTTEFEEVRKIVEKIEAEEKTKAEA